MTKKDEELKCAKFFIDRLNHRHSLDYKVIPNEKEDKSDSEIDVYAISNTNPALNIQLVTRERVLIQMLANLRKISKLTGKNVVRGPSIDHDTESWIIQAVQKKQEHYPIDVKRNLILLITGEVGALFNIDYARKIFSDLGNSDFKGIYSVHLPLSSGESSHPHNGQIIAIKGIFNNHGEEL